MVFPLIGKNLFIKAFMRSVFTLMVLITLFSLPLSSLATEAETGKTLFMQHCAGCHVNGGNIIRRGKTLKLSALKRNGIDSAEAIARIARHGQGIMSGYEKVLGEDGDKLVAIWIWEQAQNAWVQG